MDRFKNMGYDNSDYGMANQGYYDNGGYMSGAQNYMAANMGMNPMQAMTGGGIEGMIPPNDQNINYYQEYCRLYIANVVLTNQMKELIAEKNELLTRLTELEKGQKTHHHREHKETEDYDADKKSRIRRKAADVERHYQCPNTSCNKSYGSEGSLFQHVKLKHPEITDDPEWKMKLHKPENDEEGGHT